MVMLMSDLFDDLTENVESMDGLKRTYFIDSIYKDFERSKRISDDTMEGFYRVFLTTLIKDYGH
jgi:hypothetical protein